MLNSIRRALASPRLMRETKAQLEDWCPTGVEVVHKDDAYWLHFGGMIYSFPYTQPQEPSRVQYLSEHLENHKWCLELTEGVYTHRSLLQAWARKYLPDAIVIGCSKSDVISPYETTDRPLHSGLHNYFVMLHDNQFVYTTRATDPLSLVAMDLRKKSEALAMGERIYFRGNFSS